MNLVMSDITRNKLGCYMAQQASLNNIPVFRHQDITVRHRERMETRYHQTARHISVHGRAGALFRIVWQPLF